MDEIYNILVVDDNPENLKVVSGFLKDSGYKIALALNGASAMKVLHDNPIDLILLDIMMPEIDGFEVCKQIKEIKELREIPIIFLTAKNDTNDIIKGFQAGGIDYITKPFIYDELLIRIKNHIDLSKSRKKLLDTLKTRDKLYSIIAHDIKGPFGNISMLISLIANGMIDTASEQFKNLMIQLEKSTKDTYTLLNNLLEWTKLQVGNITLKPQNINLSLLLADCVQLLQGNATNKKITIRSEIEEDLYGFFDEVTIHSVFRNIITNAIKFTPENGTIQIQSEKNNQFITIHITDNGVGIPNEIIEKIFTKNEHYTTRGTNNEQGSGLGLHIIKEMTEQNKGKVSIESKEGEGTKISISIPVS